MKQREEAKSWCTKWQSTISDFIFHLMFLCVRSRFSVRWGRLPVEVQATANSLQCYQASLHSFYDNHLEFVTHFLNNLNLKCSYTSNEDFFFFRWMDTIQIGDGQYCSRLRSLLNLSKLWCKIAMDVISMSLPNVHLIIWFNGYVQLQYGQPNCIFQSITPMIGIFWEKKIT